MMDKKQLIDDLLAVRVKSPLVQNITNYVVMNNTANALLALGASPIMAHAKEEMVEMTSIVSALVLNIGTLSNEWVDSMILAGKTALKKGIPIVLDPVGAGATSYRTDTCLRLIKECKPSVIRGNGSEIMALVDSDIKTKGVDSSVSSSSALDSAKYLAKEACAVVVISGEIDYITDGEKVIEVRNGSTMMTKVTGMGCTATALVGAFLAVNSDTLTASANAMAIMGIAGEISATKSLGTGSMQVNFLDELYIISEKEINRYLR
ncbi:MAG: hydroxyethylthiazole kinase [Bacteroidetes bacterium]|nr:hydroxyethylthiazole kinase [Bacteroidota bacterium]